MRTWAVAATVVILGSAASAAAAAAAPSPAAAPETASDTAAMLNRAAFAPRSVPTAFEPAAIVLGRETYALELSPSAWTAGESRLVTAPRSFGAQPYELALTRAWPGAVSFEGRSFGFDLSPHAGLGVGALGGTAEAGAMVQVSRRESLSETASERLKSLGLRDGARFGDKGRWYLFAAASGRAVGLNMLRSEGGWDRSWSQDATSTLVGDAQVGLGWRKGPMQTSVGYMHRQVKGQHMLWGVDPKDDDMVAVSLSIKPRR